MPFVVVENNVNLTVTLKNVYMAWTSCGFFFCCDQYSAFSWTPENSGDLYIVGQAYYSKYTSFDVQEGCFTVALKMEVTTGEAASWQVCCIVLTDQRMAGSFGTRRLSPVC